MPDRRRHLRAAVRRRRTSRHRARAGRRRCATRPRRRRDRDRRRTASAGRPPPIWRTGCTDVGRRRAGRPVDQVISLRYPSYAVRHPRHVCWLNHTMREYYDLWPRFAAVDCRRAAGSRSACAAPPSSAVDTWLLKHHVTRARRAVGDGAAPAARCNGVEAEVLLPAAAAAAVSLRRLRRLPVRRLAADAAQARRPGAAGAGRAGRAGPCAA